MPLTQSAVRAVYDFGAPSAEGIVLGFRVRNQMGGKLNLIVENPISSRPATPGFENTGLQLPFTYSIQVAPVVAATGLPDTFADTSAAANLEAVVDVVATPGCHNSHTILLRPNVDAFVAVIASGGARGQLIVDNDHILDLWRTTNPAGDGGGTPDLTPV
jgi:hypothetical protein